MKEKAKNMVKYLYAVLFLVPATTLAQFTYPSGTNLPGDGGTSLYTIIQNIMRWLLSILGFVAVIGFVISGILYLVAAGDEDAQARAKRAMIYSITGVIVGMAGLVVLYAVGKFWNANSNF
ncbi:MAG: pilin [Candidatus Moranbacteria bacterium]|nr:pilin [Candidatus Moranbacteria bacterium]